MTQAIMKSLLVCLLITLIFLPACAKGCGQADEGSSRTLPLHPQNLGDYLKDLFESHGIILDKDDFLGPVEDPYLAFAKILNLITSSHQSDQKITQETAEQISKQFLSIKDKILLDGLYGKIDMHEHYRDGGDIEEFLKAAVMYNTKSLATLVKISLGA